MLRGVALGALEYGGALGGHMKEQYAGAVHAESEKAFRP
jgi:hypothetical protein